MLALTGQLIGEVSMAKSGSTTIIRAFINSLFSAATEDEFNREDIALREYAKCCSRARRRDLIAYSDAVRSFNGYPRLRVVAA
jgi:hypothetical protein